MSARHRALCIMHRGKVLVFTLPHRYDTDTSPNGHRRVFVKKGDIQGTCIGLKSDGDVVEML